MVLNNILCTGARESHLRLTIIFKCVYMPQVNTIYEMVID